MTRRVPGRGGCGGCAMARVRRHLERAAAELGQAGLAWGVWADGIRQLAERYHGLGVLDEHVLDDPGYGQALDAGSACHAAAAGVTAALAAAGGGAGCPCAMVKAAIGSPRP